MQKVCRFFVKCFKTQCNCLVWINPNFKLDFFPKVLTNLFKTNSTGEDPDGGRTFRSFFGVCVVPGLMMRVLFRARIMPLRTQMVSVYTRTKEMQGARAFTCVKMRRSCTPADYIYILDVVLRAVLLYLPDKIEQNMALRISSVAIYVSSIMYIKQACHVNSLIFLITTRLFR